MLTAKQEAFAQAIADGMSQSDAYRSAYSTDKMADKTVWEKAARLFAEDKVRARVEELREALAEKQLWTRADSVNALKGVVQQGKGSEITGAVKELNAMHGYNEPVKTEVLHKGADVAVYSLPDNGRSADD